MPATMPASAQRLPPPLSADQAELLARLSADLDAPRLWWLSGYAAGLAGRLAPAPPIGSEPTRAAAPTAALTIVYGTQTGNARRLAEQLADQCQAAGLEVRLLRADAYPPRELQHERCLYLVISTQGDGDPPDDARALVEFISGKRAPALKELRYAVLGLGDSSYPQFCAIGRQLDARLAELGATRLEARGDADLDFDTVAGPWLERALASAKTALQSAPTLASVTPLRPLPAIPVAATRETPSAAELLGNQRLTTRDSARDIRHLELSLQGSGLHYEPGDALGVWPRNSPVLVEAVLDTLGLDGDGVIEHGGQALPLRRWLAEQRELTRLARPFLASHASLARSELLERLLASDRPEQLAALLARTQVIDLLQQYPAQWSPPALLAALRPLAPRLYSIASSRKVVGEEAHLTVAHVEYATQAGPRWGAASHFMCASEEGAQLPVYLERNERFRLPQDPSRDVIMVGPGTGVAPFRGFVQERSAVGAQGRNWLLFGNRESRSEFLYQLEWQQALKDGRLQRLDLAFSRDRTRALRDGVVEFAPAKTYVQHRLREHGRELYAWLENGAHLYVCGAIAMGKDVHATLLEVIARHGSRNADDASDYLNDLARQGRYARDVY